MYDLIVLGGGPGGMKAAEVAGSRGLKVALVEKEHLGGTCLNRGCIPTKALYSHVIGGKGAREGLWSRLEGVVEKLRTGAAQTLKLSKVNVIKGVGTVTSWGETKKLSVVKPDGSTEVLEAPKLLIATGARSVVPDFAGNDLPQVLTGDWAIIDPQLWDPDRNGQVKTVAVLGAGVIALEMATILQGLGKDVILLKHSDQILRRIDGDLKKKVVQTVKKRKTTVYDYVHLTSARQEGDGLVLSGTAGEEPLEVACDRLILASSMVPILDGFGLEDSGVEIKKGCIAVDSHMRTSLPGVWAIGDCTGGAMLAHLAEYQAVSAAFDMLGDDYSVDLDALPACVFIDPEVAYVGLTEEQAKERGEEIVTSKAYFAANGMALAMGEGDGFIKVVARASDKRLLGVHIIGPEAASLLGEASLAVSKGLTAHDVAFSVHSHPTLCECFKDACMRLAE